MKKVSKTIQATPGNKFYVTTDRMLAAALISNDINPTLIAKDIDGNMHYSFMDATNLRRMLRQYYAGALKVNVDYYSLVTDLYSKPYDW